MSKITSHLGFYPLQLLAHDRCSINVCPSDCTELNSISKSHSALEGSSSRQKILTGLTVRLKLTFQIILSNFETFLNLSYSHALTPSNFQNLLGLYD